MGIEGPEPPNEQENFTTTGINILNIGQNSSDDSDQDETNLYEGYEPIPAGDVIDNIEIDDNSCTIPEISTISDLPNITSNDREIEREIWSQPRPQDLDIDLDTNKTQEIMSAMANITLPTSSIPDWAKEVPEDQWKDNLLQKIREKSNF